MSQNEKGNSDNKKNEQQAKNTNQENKNTYTRKEPPRLRVGKKSITDKTRLAPSIPSDGLQSAKATEVPASAKNDQTVYRSKPQMSNNKTRVAPRADRQSQPQAQLQPQSQPSSQVTKIAPAKVKTKPPSSDRKHVLKERFVLEKVLGAGGMGVVYKARDLLKVEAQDRDPYVAIKVLSEEFKSHPEAFISLQRESRKSQRIQHANIVNVYDFDRDGDTVFMTMEYLDGDPLDDLIARYKSTGLPTDDAWNAINGMIDALSSAHKEKIIHSDFKPGNVFVTRKGLAKVFDFGIARAVAQVEQLDGNKQDQTLFDAGNLGALTPAYASLEMLEGKEPDVRDDIYALGCVIYEVLTGEHPYNKIPADEAHEQSLKPKKINHVKKFQWRAIEKAISFKRQDRPATVKEFKSLMTPKIKSSNWLVTGVAIAFALSVTAYFLVLKKEPVVNEFSEFDIRNELELSIRIDFLKKDIDLLLTDSNFSTIWQDAIWSNFSDLEVLTKGEDDWLDANKENVFKLYVEKIEDQLRNRDYSTVALLITNAQRYGDKTGKLEELSTHLELAIKQEEVRKQALLKARNEAAKKQQAELKIIAAKEKKIEQTNSNQAEEKEQQKAARQQFNLALQNVNDQLTCQANLNMRNFETAINKLEQLDLSRYKSLESKIIDSLANCISQIGKSFPKRARAAQKHALKVFDSPFISAITIKDRDPCDAAIAGLGSRGKRAICKDALESKISGPELVVIPANSKLAMFAIGKYEVSVTEFNAYCKNTNKCRPDNSNQLKPVSGLSIKEAEAYLRWLSEQSGKIYRLPDKQEWLHAARSRGRKLDPNRNCALSTRGFEKGDNLMKYTVGQQNAWGLVNYVGNVQEWVRSNGRQLEVMGGSFREPMEGCTIATNKKHDGLVDNYTGLRVLREISE